MKAKSILLIIVLIVTISCSKDEIIDADVEGTVKLVSAEDFKSMIENKEVQLIDVRRPQEYNSGYIANAININFYDDDFLTQMNALNKEKIIYIYCGSAVRSTKAAEKLKKEGFKSIIHLEGGITSWKSKGFPIVT